MTTPLPYQRVGVDQMHKNGSATLLADEMGLGKTFQTLLFAREVKSRPMIVICPASLKINWQREASHHVNYLSDILEGRRAPKSAGIIGHNRIVIINYEILPDWVDYLAALNPEMVVWDEAHRVKNFLTQSYRALSNLLKLTNPKYKIAISGTPLPNRPAELWATLHLLWPDQFPNFKEYGFQFCKPKFERGKWTFRGKKNLPELHALLNKLGMIRRKKKDVLKDLPAQTRKVITIDLSKKDRKEYEFCKNHFSKWIMQRHPARAVASIKNQRLTNIGYRMRMVAKMKRFVVVDWIRSFDEQSEGKLLIFSTHTAAINYYASKFKGRSVIIDGSVRGVKRQIAIDAFQKDPEIKFAFCHPVAAGVGLNLTAASDVLFTDVPLVPNQITQGESRVHRIGTKKACTTWFIVARDTVEEFAVDLVTDKQSTVNAVIDGKAEDEETELDILEEIYKHETTTNAA